MIDAGSFVASVWLFAHLPKLPREPGRAVTGRGLKGVRDDAVDGLRYVFGHTVIRALTIGFWLIVFCTGADDLVLPFLGRDTLHTGAFGIGLLLAGASIGLVATLSVLAATSRAHRGPARSKGSERGRLIGQTARIRAVLVGFGLAAVGNLLTAFAPIVSVAVATQIVRGSGLALIDTNVQTVLQRESDPEKLGRVMANVWGGVGVTAALSYAAGGPLLDSTSPRTMFIIIGTSGLACTLLTMVLLRGPLHAAATLTLIHLMRVEGRGGRAVLLSGTWVWGTSGHTGVAEALAAVLCVRDHGGRRGACLARSRTSWWSGR